MPHRPRRHLQPPRDPWLQDLPPHGVAPLCHTPHGYPALCRAPRAKPGIGPIGLAGYAVPFLEMGAVVPLSATKWLPKWLGCEPRLIVLITVSLGAQRVEHTTSLVVPAQTQPRRGCVPQVPSRLIRPTVGP